MVGIHSPPPVNQFDLFLRQGQLSLRPILLKRLRARLKPAHLPVERIMNVIVIFEQTQSLPVAVVNVPSNETHQETFLKWLKKQGYGYEKTEFDGNAVMDGIHSFECYPVIHLDQA